MKGFSSSSSLVFSQNISDLWKAISVENNLNSSHPFCKENKTLEWSDKEHKDVLTYLNGVTYFREFSEWFEGIGYNLWIGEANGPKSFVEWRIKEHPKGSELSITVYPHLLHKWPKVIAFMPYWAYVDPKLKSYLNSVLKGFKWNLDTNTAVKRNQFGKHSWFS
jgi:hypothetical protein